MERRGARNCKAIQRDWGGHVHIHSGSLARLTHFLQMIPSLPDDEQERRTRRLLDGACRLVDSMKEVGEDLPLFRAVFSPHDNPNAFLTAEMKRQAVEAGSTLSPKKGQRKGQYVSSSLLLPPYVRPSQKVAVPQNKPGDVGRPRKGDQLLLCRNSENRCTSGASFSNA
jgi:hypothetical protein